MCRQCREQHPELYTQMNQAFEQLIELKKRANKKSTTLTNEAIDYAVQRYNAAMKTIKETHNQRKESL
jgi:molybdenum-dependent DNA-binding transcriptional regulator ModE